MTVLNRAPRDLALAVLTVLRGALWQVAIGFTIGIAAAVALGRVLEQQLYGVSARDPRIIAASAFMLAACTAVAALISRRAGGVDRSRACASRGIEAPEGSRYKAEGRT